MDTTHRRKTSISPRSRRSAGGSNAGRSNARGSSATKFNANTNRESGDGVARELRDEESPRRGEASLSPEADSKRNNVVLSPSRSLRSSRSPVEVLDFDEQLFVDELRPSGYPDSVEIDYPAADPNKRSNVGINTGSSKSGVDN